MTLQGEGLNLTGGEGLNLTGGEELLLRNTQVCIEDWSGGEELSVDKQQRLSYTLLSVAAQYLLPLAVITVVYGEIYNFLKVLNYLSQQETNNSLVLSQDRRLLNRAKKRKLRRTTGILLLISLVFCLRSWAASLSRKNMVFFSWLPFSILRILTELVVDLHEQTGNLSSVL